MKHNGNDKLGYGIWLYFSIEYMIATVVVMETPLCKDKVGGSLTRDDLKVEEGSRVIVPCFFLAGLRARFAMPCLFEGHGGVVSIFLRS